MNLLSLLDDLKAKREKATKGPWDCTAAAIQNLEEKTIVAECAVGDPQDLTYFDNASFITLACNSSETLETSLREAIELNKLIVSRSWFDAKKEKGVACSSCDLGEAGEKTNDDGHDYYCPVSNARAFLEKWGVGK